MVYYEITSTDTPTKYTLNEIHHLILKNDGANAIWLGNTTTNKIFRLDGAESVTWDFLNNCGILDISELYVKTETPLAFSKLRISGW